jgi:tetratricopeptide (TPR) repeat protein
MLSQRFSFLLALTASALCGGQSARSAPPQYFANSDTPPAASQQQSVLTTETRGDIFMARKQYADAIDMYRKSDLKSPVIENKIGIAFHQMQRLDQARKYYEKAIKLRPDYPEAINNLGTIFYSEKSYRRAVGCYKRALRFSPQSAAMMANLGMAYFARHDYDRASEMFNLALATDPMVFEHHGQYGELLQERSVEEMAKFHLFLAKAHAKKGENEQAIMYLRKALEEGVKDRNKIPDMPEFAALKTDAAFIELMASAPKPL